MRINSRLGMMPILPRALPTGRLGMCRIVFRFDFTLKSIRRGLQQLLDNMANRPILYRHNNFILVTFGVPVTAGAMLWMVVTGACLLAHELPYAEVAIFFVGAAISALLLSHAFWWLGNLPSLISEPLLGSRKVGFVSWGGLAGLVIFLLGFSLASGYDLFTLSDDVLRGMFAAYAAGRLGCLTYGCCYGTMSGKDGIRFRHPASKVVREKGTSSAPRYATQLYSCLEGIALFIIVNAIPCFDVPAGVITAASFLIYPVGRAYVEVFRDRKRYIRSLFTSGHLASLLMFACGLLFLHLVPDPSDSALPVMPLSIIGLCKALSLAPVIILISAAVFLATSFHWKQVGTW